MRNIVLLALFCSVAGGAMAQGLISQSDASKPVSIAADKLDIDTKTKSATYVGNVQATQGAIKLRADRFHYDRNAGRLTLEGHVRTTILPERK